MSATWRKFIAACNINDGRDHICERTLFFQSRRYNTASNLSLERYYLAIYIVRPQKQSTVMRPNTRLRTGNTWRKILQWSPAWLHKHLHYWKCSFPCLFTSAFGDHCPMFCKCYISNQPVSSEIVRRFGWNRADEGGTLPNFDQPRCPNELSGIFHRIRVEQYGRYVKLREYGIANSSRQNWWRRHFESRVL